MKSKAEEKPRSSSAVQQKSPMSKQNKTRCEASSGVPAKRRGRPPIARLRSRSSGSDSEPVTKKRKISPSKSAGPKPGANLKKSQKLKSSKDKKSKALSAGKTKKNSTGKPSPEERNSKKQSGAKSPKSGTYCKTKVKSKTTGQKKKSKQDQNGNQFLDLWALATIGKREASLNATMKVNILYERQTSPKKAACLENSNSQSPKSSSEPLASVKKEKPSKVKDKEAEKKSHAEKKTSDSANDKKSSKKCTNNKETETIKKNIQNRKRKASPYTIFEDDDEPPSKSRKGDNNSSKTKSKKQPKKRGKSNILKHHLGNIIERSPRQASLNAKAMIAMGQEEEIVVSECSARTGVYDWMEVRPYLQNDESRQMVWMTGRGDPKFTKILSGKGISSDGLRKKTIVGKSSTALELITDKGKLREDVNGNLANSSVHNTVLKAIHEIGDPRLLREYLRSQKEDFDGDVDVETCPTPTPSPSKNVEKAVQSSPSPKKKPPPPFVSTKTSESPCKKPQAEKEKKMSAGSPAKPMPCRVATPIPQFPADQRPTHMTSFVHHPVPQSFYPGVQQQPQPPQQQSQPHPQSQPIKVTPYSPSPAYIYQYPPPPGDRQQQNLFVPGNPSTLQYGVENNGLPQRDYSPSTFNFNHIGSLSLGRRGLNPYHQSGSYNPSIHLPMQAFGFNFHGAAPQYYQPSLQHMQAQQQQNLSTMQSVPLQQTYPLVHQQASMISPHPLVQNLNQLQTYQAAAAAGFSPYANLNAPAHMNQEHAKGMPPPPSPTQTPSNPSPQKESPPAAHSHSLLQSPSKTRPMPIHPFAVPATKCAKSFKNLEASSSPVKFPPTSPYNLSKRTGEVAVQTTTKPQAVHSLLNFGPPPAHVHKRAPTAFSLLAKHSGSPFQIVPVCKKEQMSADNASPTKNQSGERPQGPPNDSPSKSHFKVIGDDSSVSDILHSAHSTMFPAEAPPPASSEPQFTSPPHLNSSCAAVPSSSSTAFSSFVSSSSKSCQTPKEVTVVKSNRFSVSSILDMPTIKVKNEAPLPLQPSCSKGAIKIIQGNQSIAKGPAKPGTTQTFLICIPPPHSIGGKPTAKLPIQLLPASPVKGTSLLKKPDLPRFKEGELQALRINKDKVIIIDDSDSSDDEPLVNLVHSKPSRPVCGNSKAPQLCNPMSSQQSKAVEVKLTDNSSKVQSKTKQVKAKSSELPKVNVKQFKAKTVDQPKFTQLHAKLSKECQESVKIVQNLKQSLKKQATLPAKLSNVPDVSASKSDGKNPPKKVKVVKMKGSKPPKKSAVRRKSKDASAQPSISAVHGWTWVGEGERRAVPKLSQQKEEPVRERLCFKSMRHMSGEIISVKDSVILHSDGDGSAPYVARVSALWENLNGDMMFSMLWYYQPEHTTTGRECEDGEQELFASKHREENSVACIDDKCYVLMYNEYCRMEAEAVRISLGLPLPRWRELIPALSEEEKKLCRPLPPATACLDNIWFCRYDYDTRKKIVRKPKHKKTDLRYRAPCKLVV